MTQAKKSQTATSETMQLWQSSMPIQKALIKFADPDLLERLHELSKTSFATEWAKTSQVDLPNNSKMLESMVKAQNTTIAASNARTEIEHQINQHIMNMLFDLELRCFAFEFPRTFTSEPVEMQIDHWTVHPNWKTGEYKANGLHLIELRVLLQGDAASLITIPEPATLGRPTIKPQIGKAFQDVLDSGILSKEMSLKTISEHVRKQLAKANPTLEITENKPNFETIRRVISPLWKGHNKQ